MDDANLADDTEISFVVTNTNVAATDVIIVNHGSAGTMGAYVVQASNIGSGTFEISVKNVSGGTLGQAIVINFVVIKGASS
jgi:ribulose 1,5-bisphosphate synthetase/thiazole synthase